MSFAATHESKRTRQACQSCRDRKARFSFRGSVRADRDHTLCFECYRRERERQRARRLVEGPAALSLWMPSSTAGLGGSLSDRQVAHRQTMFAHLARQFPT